MALTREAPRVMPVAALRAVLVLLTSATTIGLGGIYAYGLFRSGAPWLLIAPSVLLFLVLTAWVAIGFWQSVVGFFRVIRRERRRGVPLIGAEGPPLAAIVVPVHNENPQRVMAGLRATYESVAATGRLDRIGFYILSDTTDAEVWLEEEAAWKRLVDELGAEGRITYRHRAENTRKKVGNIEDFCERWGDRYRYMIVFDADSVMDGRTIVAMISRMEAEPGLGILQAPASPVNRESLFARIQQFASAVYGPVFTAGLAGWAAGEGNYYGHNAIIRLEPFRRHCRLPVLPSGPLGGEIMSHDFVEAAMMRRAGYRVEIATDLPFSYEESPTTVIDFAKRDQRWCHGNLQHLLVLRRERLHNVSRFHLLSGALAYLSAPLWAVFIVLNLALAFAAGGAGEDGGSWPGALGGVAFACVMLMLLLPKGLGLLALVWHEEHAARFGGAGRAALGVLAETAVSVVLAPVFMAFYTWFVVAALLGRRIAWTAQGRDERRTTLAEAADAHGAQLIAGVLLLWLASRVSTGLMWWLGPIWGGLILSIPMSMALSSARLGRLTRRWRLFAISEEIREPAVLRRLNELRAAAPADARAPAEGLWIDRLRADASFNRLHCALQRAAGVPEDDSEAVRKFRGIVASDGAAFLPNEARVRLLLQPDVVATLLEAGNGDAVGAGDGRGGAGASRRG